MKNPQNFLEKITNELGHAGIEIENLLIDHICYRTISQSNYHETKEHFSAFGELLIESMVGGRPIATYKLHEPISFKKWSIPLVEVPAPKKGKDVVEGYEHIEVVIKESFEAFMKAHCHLTFKTKAIVKELNPEIEIELPSGSVKFHHQSLEKVIQIEKELGS